MCDGKSPVERWLTKQEQSDIVDPDVRGTSLYADRLVRRLQTSVKRLCAELEKKEREIDEDEGEMTAAWDQVWEQRERGDQFHEEAEEQRQRADTLERDAKKADRAFGKLLITMLKERCTTSFSNERTQEEQSFVWTALDVVLAVGKLEAQLILIEKMTREEFGKCLTCANVHDRDGSWFHAAWREINEWASSKESTPEQTHRIATHAQGMAAAVMDCVKQRNELRVERDRLVEACQSWLDAERDPVGEVYGRCVRLTRFALAAARKSPSDEAATPAQVTDSTLNKKDE